MKLLKISTVLLATIILMAGCGQRSTAQQIETETAEPMLQTQKQTSQRPILTFQSKVYDFGEVGPSTKNRGEFNFQNTGNETLEITSVSKSCGCTPFTMDKTVFEPGEDGTIKFEYNAATVKEEATKHLFVNSNDPENPRIPLSIKANVVLKVTTEPNELNLSMIKENAGASDITIKARDGQTFSIKEIKSTNNVFSFSYDPDVKSSTFVLKPTVDMEKLKQVPAGRINLILTHPDCSQIILKYEAPAEYESKPASIVITNAEQGITVNKKIWIQNNYQKPVNVESVTSQKGLIKLINQENIEGKTMLDLEIYPPENEENLLFFSDVLEVHIQNAETLKINCRGFYLMSKK